MQAKGSVALVTGASRGLGLEIAKAYAQCGMRLAITAREKHALHDAATALERFTDVYALAGDVADPRHAERLVRETVSEFGTLDVLINNASELGPSPMPSLQNLAPSEYERILAVNTLAPLHLAQLALPHLIYSKGILMNVSSDAGVTAYPGWGGYGSSKAALEHWSRILAEEIEAAGVRIFVVDPGDMDTLMHRLAEPGVDLSHLPKPSVVAPVFVQLLADPRSFARVEAQKVIPAQGIAS